MDAYNNAVDQTAADAIPVVAHPDIYSVVDANNDMAA